MQEIFVEHSGLFISLFWITLIVIGLIAVLRKPPVSQLQKDMQEQNKNILKQYEKEQKELIATVKVIAPPDPVLTKRHKGRATLPVLTYVDFDPKNIEHCRAAQMLKANPARQHPTLRFHYDSSAYDSAYAYIVGTIIDFHCASLVKTKRVRKTPPPSAVIPLRSTNP